MPRILSNNYCRRASVWARRDQSTSCRRSSGTSCSSGSPPSGELTDSSRSSSLSSEFEALSIMAQHQETGRSSTRACITRSPTSQFNLAALGGEESSSRNCGIIRSKEHSILNVNYLNGDDSWGQFVDVATWLEDPLPPRVLSRNLPYARPSSVQQRGKIF